MDGLEGLDDTSLALDLGANEGFELSEDLLSLDGLDEIAGADAQDVALADNDWEYADVKYVDAKGKQQGPVRCAVLRGGDDHIIGNGWYAVTRDISYASGMIVWGETNLILCDGATLTDTDGIWVQDSARLTVWAQSNDEKTMGKLIAQGGQKKGRHRRHRRRKGRHHRH